MQTIITLLLLGWVVRLVVNLLSYVHLWYVKEYRWDRMWVHLHTKQGKLILFPAQKIPPISPKTVALFGFTAASYFVLFFILPFHALVNLLVLDIALFPVTAMLVLCMKLPTWVYHEYKIIKAQEKLKAHVPMIVIGITGSFGKTSTKEYLATILSRKYNVLKTEASKNSPIGIAETILENLTPEHEIFVVEMGAYKRGEIRSMAEMVQPEIGIVTAINPQHQDLFGTIETTMKAKYELIQGLIGKRIAIFNGDGRYTKQMAQWAKRDGCVVWFYAWKEGLHNGFIATNIRADLKGVSFDVIAGKTDARVRAPVLGKHQVGTILAALAGAIAAGMTLGEATKAAAAIKPFTKTLEPVPGVNGSLFINDTFNNSPDAAKAALDVLAMAKGRKMLVFQPMIELGSYTEISHKEVGAAAARRCDDIILTNSNFSQYFIDGVRSVNLKKSVSILNPIETANFIRDIVKKGDAILFKGKEAEFTFRLLI